MEYTLKNKKLTVVFESKGATLHSIKDNDGVEYLWEGNPEYWSGQAPVLFPICGSIRDDKAQILLSKEIDRFFLFAYTVEFRIIQSQVIQSV